MGCLALWMPRHTAEEFLREAVRLRFHVETLHDLSTPMRALAFQRTVVTCDLLERDGVPLDMIGADGNRDHLLWPSGSITEPEGLYYRDRIAAAFSRAFDVTAEGPPWQVGTADINRPTHDEWIAFCGE
jgi:hypothetical protein